MSFCADRSFLAGLAPRTSVMFSFVLMLARPPFTFVLLDGRSFLVPFFIASSNTGYGVEWTGLLRLLLAGLDVFLRREVFLRGLCAADERDVVVARVLGAALYFRRLGRQVFRRRLGAADERHVVLATWSP